MYSEKATKFCEIFPLLWTKVHTVKSKGKISQNFVAFSEYMNFKSDQEQEQQPMEVTQHESIMETLPTQVLSQPVVETESSFHDENDNTNLLEPEIDLPICNETHQLGLIL